MKILNFGSLNIDRVYALDNFVQAGETVSVNNLKSFAGGKGLNQSIAAARAGARVAHVGAIGTEGEFLAQLLSKAGVGVSMLRTLNAPTGHAIIQVNESGQNCIIVYGGTNQMLTKEHIDAAMEQGEVGDIVLLQNEVNNIAYIIDRAYTKGLQVAFNPSPIPKNLESLPLEKVTYFIVNEIEGAAIAGCRNTDSDFEQIIKTISEKFPNAKIVLTLGEKGVLYQDADISASHPIFKVKATDTTAAGDTFCGYFLAGLCQDLPLEVCLKRASAASAISVTKSGAELSIPTKDMVEAFLESQV